MAFREIRIVGDPVLRTPCAPIKEITPGVRSLVEDLLENVNVVGTPGSGFGPSGEHYFRLTAFGSYENTVEAVDRLKKIQL